MTQPPLTQRNSQVPDPTLLHAKESSDPASLLDHLPLTATPVAGDKNPLDVFVRNTTTDPIPVSLGAVVDANNSTTTLLGASETFTGAFTDILDYSNVAVFIYSDQASEAAGLIFEWSDDGITVRDDDTYNYTPAQNGVPYSFGRMVRFFRVRYVNGATPQTSFGIQTILSRGNFKPSSHRIEDEINDDNDAELVKAVQTGKNPDGAFVNNRTSGVFSLQSTTTPLLAGGEFIGPIESSQGYSGIRLILLTNVASAAGGGRIQWFNDAAGTFNAYTDTFFWPGAIVGTTYATAVRGPFFRVRYINGTSNQAVFVLLTMGSTDLQLSTSAGNSIRPGITEALFVRPVNDRLNLVAGRTHITEFIENVTLGAGTTIHTVTAGKTFYMTNYSITAVNTGALGRIVLQDGTDTTDRIPFIMPAQVAGDTSPYLAATKTMEQLPKAFITDVRAIGLSGTIVASIEINGYEQDN